jgi:hypothetical protein
MEVCGWSMGPAFGVAAPVLCASSANGKAVPPKSLARSACCFILSALARLLSCGMIGVAGGIDVPASSSCGPREWMCSMGKTVRSVLSRRLRPFLAHNERIIGSPLLSGSHAMSGSLRQADRSSRSSEFQKPSRCFSGLRRPDLPSCFSQERSISAERQPFPRRAPVFLVFPCLGCSHLLRILVFFLLWLSPFSHANPRSDTLSNTSLTISSSTTHCALRGNQRREGTTKIIETRSWRCSHLTQRRP